MNLLLILVVALTGSALADDLEWTEEMVQDLFAGVSRTTVATPPELIANEGYPVETHNIVTEDGYILEMYRIPGSPKNSHSSRGKPVALLVHGLLSSCVDWIIMGPERGLGYILADAGYDVWLGNVRGNTYSKNHTENLSDSKYWHFSWHEIGTHDLPAMIDYSLAASGQNQVVYVGHSQGTTAFFVMGAERPEYNDKIKAMFALAPVAYMGNLVSPVLRWASLGTTPLEIFLSLIGVHEFLPSSDLISALGQRFCDEDALSQALCSNVLFLLCGFNEDQLDTAMLPVVLQYLPAGAATRQLVHYGQEIRSTKFRQYDLGRIENRLTYGQWTPPDYDLGLISAPVHLVYSDNDWMAAVEDVTQLYNELGNGVEMVRVADPKWNHLDFTWGLDAKTYVYDGILATLKERYSH